MFKLLLPVVFLILGTTLFAQDIKPEQLLVNALDKWHDVYSLELDGQIRQLVIISDQAYYEERDETNELLSSGTVANNEVGFVLIPAQIENEALVSEPVRIVFLDDKDGNVLTEVSYLNSENGRVINLERQ